MAVANSNVAREGNRFREIMCIMCSVCGSTLAKAARGTGECVILDIIQNKGQVSSQADRRGLHVQTVPGVNIQFDICAVCYFRYAISAELEPTDIFILVILAMILHFKSI